MEDIRGSRQEKDMNNTRRARLIRELPPDSTGRGFSCSAHQCCIHNYTSRCVNIGNLPSMLELFMWNCLTVSPSDKQPINKVLSICARWLGMPEWNVSISWQPGLVLETTHLTRCPATGCQSLRETTEIFHSFIHSSLFPQTCSLGFLGTYLNGPLTSILSVITPSQILNVRLLEF